MLTAWRTRESKGPIVILINLTSELASKYTVIDLPICAYMRNVPNSECLGQQNDMLHVWLHWGSPSLSTVLGTTVTISTHFFTIILNTESLLDIHPATVYSYSHTTLSVLVIDHMYYTRPSASQVQQPLVYNHVPCKLHVWSIYLHVCDCSPQDSAPSESLSCLFTGTRYTMIFRAIRTQRQGI